MQTSIAANIASFTNTSTTQTHQLHKHINSSKRPVNMRKGLHAYIYICMYVCVCVCIIYIYIYIYTQTHTHIQTYITSHTDASGTEQRSVTKLHLLSVGNRLQLSTVSLLLHSHYQLLPVRTICN